MGRKRNSGFFVKSEDIFIEWAKWRDSSPDLNSRVIGEQLAVYIKDIATHLTSHHRFSRYPMSVKEDMISDAIVKCFKNLKNVKEQYKGSLFSYFTNTCWCAFITYLIQYYKDINMKRKLITETLDELTHDNVYVNPQLINHLRQELELYEKGNEDNED